MQDINLGPINERETVSELEPVVLAQITEVTGTGVGSMADADCIVWGIEV